MILLDIIIREADDNASSCSASAAAANLIMEAYERLKRCITESDVFHGFGGSCLLLAGQLASVADGFVVVGAIGVVVGAVGVGAVGVVVGSTLMLLLLQLLVLMMFLLGLCTSLV